MAVETMLMLHLGVTDMAKAKAFSVETFPSVQEKEGCQVPFSTSAVVLHAAWMTTPCSAPSALIPN